MHQFSINDVDVIVKPIPSSSSVTLTLFLDVGLPKEFDDQIGISHFLEHMCFRGTKHRSAYQITKEVDSLGGQVNAYTTKEFTCYYITVLPENVTEGFDILCDIVFHSLHEQKNIELEKSIITEEINMYEDTPDEKILDLLSESLFDNAYLGKPILGTQSTIGQFDTHTLMSYYSNYFIPENVKCVIAGSINDLDELKSMIDASFQNVSFQKVKKTQLDSESSIQFKTKVNHVEKDLEQMHLSYGFPGLNYNDPDRYALTLLTTLMGGSMSSRLFQSVREKAGLAYSIFCSTNIY